MQKLTQLTAKIVFRCSKPEDGVQLPDDLRKGIHLDLWTMENVLSNDERQVYALKLNGISAN